MGMFGFGTSENKSTTNVNNNQVATESGIAIGGGASGNNISIMTADPEIAKAALASNASVAGLSILSANDLSSKYSAASNDMFAKSTALLQSSNQDAANLSTKLVQLADKSLQSSFQNAAQSTQAAPSVQSDTLTSKIMWFAVGLLAVGAAAFYFFRRGK